MSDETNDKPSIAAGIYHELGKISSASESMIREMTAVRSEIKERTSAIIMKLDDHVREDNIRFKPLERMHATIYGVIAAVSVFWIVATTVVVIWLKQ